MKKTIQRRTTSWSGNRRSFPDATRREIMNRDSWRCQISGPTCQGKATQADHIIPHFEGGTDDATNGQAVCEQCHKIKTMQEQARGRKRVSGKREPMPHPGMM